MFRNQVFKYYIFNYYLKEGYKNDYKVENIEYIGFYDDYKVEMVNVKNNEKRMLILELKDLNVRYDSDILP